MAKSSAIAAAGYFMVESGLLRRCGVCPARFPRDDRGYLAHLLEVLVSLNRGIGRPDALSRQCPPGAVVDLLLQQRGGRRVFRGAAVGLVPLRRDPSPASQRHFQLRTEMV